MDIWYYLWLTFKFVVAGVFCYVLAWVLYYAFNFFDFFISTFFFMMHMLGYHAPMMAFFLSLMSFFLSFLVYRFFKTFIG